MEDCIFCKLANGVIPTKVVFEDELVTVFMDANPKASGHMLIVPKKHYTDFTEVPGDVIGHIHEVAKQMKDKVYSTLNPDGLMLVNNYGVLQEVKHYHLHVLPHYEGEQLPYDVDTAFEMLTK